MSEGQKTEYFRRSYTAVEGLWLMKVKDGMGFDQEQQPFVGSTICYAFMQAGGMVNDHTVDCFRYKEVRKKR